MGTRSRYKLRRVIDRAVDLKLSSEMSSLSQNGICFDSVRNPSINGILLAIRSDYEVDTGISIHHEDFSSNHNFDRKKTRLNEA